MDAEGYKKEPHGTDPEIFWHARPKSGNVDQRTSNIESWRLVEVFLSGGAPWGFTLRGGLEHREPLLITKVEEGSKAAAVSLQVGDELVNINEIPLSGYRQEAICLVKGSHKTLSLVVKRQNEPISRPHSWHSTKFNEKQSETAKMQSPPMAVWNKRYDASSSTDLSTNWEQTNLCRVSGQFSSLGSMDSLEHVSHPNPASQLSPAKSTNSTEHLGGGKRDSAYSSFSASSGTPDYTLSKSNAASTENMLHNVSQWEAAAKQSNSRHSQNLPSDGVKQDDRVTYFQIPGVSSFCEGPQIEDPAGNHHSTSSRTSFGPVWNIPEKKTNSSSPPPPPPARSDSFAATKVHEKGVVVVHPEGSDKQASFKAPFEHGPSHNICQKTDSDHLKFSFLKSFHNQFTSNKQYSLSSTDVRQPPQVSQSQHQKHLTDKSSVCTQPWATSMPTPHNVGGHFCSLQELPTNGSVQQFNQNQRRNLSSSLSPTHTDQTTECNLQSRYYCFTTCQPTQLNQLSLSGIPENTKSTTVSESTQNINEQTSLSPPIAIKVSYNMTQQHPSHDKHNNGYSKHQVSTVFETSVLQPNSDGHGTQNAQVLNVSYPFSRQSEQRRSLPLQNREFPRESRPHNQVSNKICPLATPMLHSLSMDAADPDEKMKGTNLNISLDSKQVKHSERFATTLRSEIQMRRARLQKSQSAAAVSGETEENQDMWKSTDCPTPSSSDGSFSNIYKDNLKEAQARVLKATSFRRRDLEPFLQDHATTEASSNHQASTQWRSKEIMPQPTVAELVTNHHGTSGGQFARVGGRKRLSVEKKMKSFSEPDKIHEVGMKENLALSDKFISSLDQQKLFQESELGLPCDMPLHKPAQDQGRDSILTNARVSLVEGIRSGENIHEAQEVPYSTCSRSIHDQQRLGTFAEYEPRWNIQKEPPVERVSERYRSADDILDRGPEEPNKSACFHERSRSSPSADLYGQKIPVPARKSDPQSSKMEHKPAEPLVTDRRFSDRGPGECKVREKLGEFECYPLPQLQPMTGSSPDCAHIGPPVTVSHKPTSNSPSLTESDDSSRPGLPPAPRKKPSMLEKPPQPRNPEVGNTHQLLASSQSEVPIHCSARADPSSSFGPTHSLGNSKQGKEPMDKGQGAAHHLSTSISQPASSPLASNYRPTALASHEGQRRSPSPQFFPQRLSDKPPLALRNENSKRMVHVIESQKTTVKKVPIRIICSERSKDKDNCPFLQQSDSPAIVSDHQGSARLTNLGAAGIDSVFCHFTRQWDPSNTSATEAQQPPQTDMYISTPMDQQPTAEHPNNNKVAVTAQLIKGDQKREELARDIAGKDKSLADILDQSKMKTTMDLMDGIFPKGEQVLEGVHQRKKEQMKQTNVRPADEREKEDSMAAAVTMVTSSTYYSTSAPKAELLIKMKDMQEEEEEEEENTEDELDIDLASKKQELINSLNKKLRVLQEARESLADDIQDNNALGDEVEAHVQQVCKPNELDKFRMFVGDLDKVVSLLLSLSGRLARVENAINSLEEDATPDERRTLIEKRKLLIRQHDDAKELKENLDRRERVVYDILANYLPEDSLTDYEHFVKMKSALIIEQRKLEDKIKLGEEQLKCLVDSLPIEQRLAL